MTEEEEDGAGARPLLASARFRLLASARQGLGTRLKSYSNFGTFSEDGGEADSDVAGGGWHRCQTRTGLPPAFLAHFALGTGVLIQGYDQTALGFLLATGYGGHLQLDAWQCGVVASIYFLGGIVGAWWAGGLNQRWGRRRPLILTALLVSAIALLGTTTTLYPWLLAVRFMYGLAAGLNNASVALYLSEISRKRERGGVVAMTELLFGTGGCLACVAQLLLQRLWTSPAGQRNGWRILLGLEALFGAVMCVGSLRSVESPHWLLQKGRDAEAERVLLRIHAPTRLPGGGCTCAERNAELAEAVESLRTQLDEDAARPEADAEDGGVLGTLALSRSPERRVRRALEISIAMALVPLIGIGCLPQQFVPLVLGARGGVGRPGAIPLDTVLIDLLCNVIYVLGAAVQSQLLVDRVGRRWPLILSLVAAGLGFQLVSAALQHGVGARAAAGVYLGYLARSVGVGPLPQVVGAEVVPIHLLTRAKSAGIMLRRASACLYCLLLPPALSLLGAVAVFRSQAAASAAAALYTWLRLPETRGFEPAEIDSILGEAGWVPFAAAPPVPSMADEVREQAKRLAARRAAAAEGASPRAAATDALEEAHEWDVWGGRGAYRG